MEANKMHYF